MRTQRLYKQTHWEMAELIDADDFRRGEFFRHPDSFYACTQCGYPIEEEMTECPKCHYEHTFQSDRECEGMFDDSFVNGFNKGR